MIYLRDERQHAVVALASLDGGSWDTRPSRSLHPLCPQAWH